MPSGGTSVLHWRYHRPRSPSIESTASGIYGLIVSAGVMVAAHATTAARLTVAVLVTLVIYWSAERYARLVAERIHEGQRPTWAHARAQLATGWEIVTASFIPLAVLLLLRMLGLDLDTSILGALIASTVLLALAGWGMGHRSHLGLADRLVMTVVAGLFGVVLVGLKTLLH